MADRSDFLEKLLWIDLPDDIETDIGPFILDPSIPLPIEQDGDGVADVEDITWEKVIAAMLLVLANLPSHEHAGYYRSFLNALRPGLASELHQALMERIHMSDWGNAEDIGLALRGLAPDAAEPRRAIAGLYAARASWERRHGERSVSEAYEESAEAAYGELLSDSETPGEVWYEAGRFRYGRGDYLRAMETLQAYVDSTNDGEHRTDAQRMVRLCRDYGQADQLYRDAYAALAAGRIDEGTALAREFRDANPAGWPGWFLLGWGLRLGENWQEARESLEGARDRGCREGDLFNELAICTRALGDYGAAALNLENALRDDPENIKVMSNMALVQMELGRRDEAERWLRTALTLEPTDPICRKLLNELETAE